MARKTSGVRQVKLVQGPVPMVLSETLGVLRETHRGMEDLPESSLVRLGFSGVWVDAVRRFATSKLGLRVFLIPGISGEGTCLPGTRQARANPGEPLVSLDIYDPTGRVGAMAYSVGDIVEGRVVRTYPLATLSDQRDEEELVFGIVPNGISSVEIKAGDMPARVARAKDNFFEVVVPVPASRGPSNAATSVTMTMTWYDAFGKGVKTVARLGRRMSLLRTRVEIPEA